MLEAGLIGACCTPHTGQRCPFIQRMSLIAGLPGLCFSQRESFVQLRASLVLLSRASSAWKKVLMTSVTHLENVM